MKTFKRIERDVFEILNAADPDGLIASGGLDDEYITQVHNIISLMVRKPSQEALESELARLFGPAEDSILRARMAAKLRAVAV